MTNNYSMLQKSKQIHPKQNNCGTQVTVDKVMYNHLAPYDFGNDYIQNLLHIC